MDSTNNPGEGQDASREGDDAMTRRMDTSQPYGDAGTAGDVPPPTYNPPQYNPPAYNPQQQQYNAPPPQQYTPPPQFVQPPQYNPTGSNYPAYPQAKDPNTAVAIEIIGGLFGLLGLGHIYAGRTQQGIMLLVGWWVAIAVVFFFLLPIIGILTLGIGCCLYPVVWLGGPIISGLWLRSLMTGQPMPFINR
ncbi:MAG: hypothetical protein ACR2M0_14785 [Chloroflexia bacterium]